MANRLTLLALATLLASAAFVGCNKQDQATPAEEAATEIPVVEEDVVVEEEAVEEEAVEEAAEEVAEEAAEEAAAE